MPSLEAQRSAPRGRRIDKTSSAFQCRYRALKKATRSFFSWSVKPIARGGPETAALYEEPLKRRKEAAWADERENIQRAVILGAPGGGKTFLTQTTSLDLARAGLQSLKERTKSMRELPCPVCLNLEDLA
jgi:hypothetical protein